jgi:hypothetical protein
MAGEGANDRQSTSGQCDRPYLLPNVLSSWAPAPLDPEGLAKVERGSDLASSFKERSRPTKPRFFRS